MVTRSKLYFFNLKKINCFAEKPHLRDGLPAKGRRGAEVSGEVNGDLPPPREVRAGGKRFYFDVASNDRGTFIKLSEV